MKGHKNDELVGHGAGQEGNEHSHGFGETQSLHTVVVNVTQHPLMHWAIPSAPPHRHCRRVPPVLIELLVSIPSALSNESQYAVKSNVEP